MDADLKKMQKHKRLTLISGLGAALLLVCASVMGAMIGEVTVRSKLGEPLLAEVPIYDLAPGEEVGMNAGLASRVVFELSDLSRTAEMESLQFEVIKLGTQWLIKITSDTPIFEPITGILVELRAGGEPYWREYAMLPEEVFTPTISKINPIASAATAGEFSRAGGSSDGDFKNASGVNSETARSDISAEGVVLAVPSGEIEASSSSSTNSISEDNSNDTQVVSATSTKRTIKPPSNEKPNGLLSSTKNVHTFSGSVSSASTADVPRDELKLLPPDQSKTATSSKQLQSLADSYALKEADERAAQLDRNISNLRAALEEKNISKLETNNAVTNDKLKNEYQPGPSIETTFAAAIGEQNVFPAKLTIAILMIMLGISLLSKSLTRRIRIFN